MELRMDDPASRFAEEVRELQAILKKLDEKTDLLPHLWEGETADLARGRYNRIKPGLNAVAAKLLALCKAEGEDSEEKPDTGGEELRLSDLIL